MSLTLSVDAEIEVDVECDACGSTLTATFDTRHDTVYVSACDKCLEEKATEAYADGLDAGRDECQQENQ